MLNNARQVSIHCMACQIACNTLAKWIIKYYKNLVHNFPPKSRKSGQDPSWVMAESSWLSDIAKITPRSYWSYWNYRENVIAKLLKLMCSGHYDFTVICNGEFIAVMGTHLRRPTTHRSLHCLQKLWIIFVAK